LAAGDTLYIFSDGAYELRAGGEDLLSLDSFEALLAKAVIDPASSLGSLIEELRRVNGRTQFSDDVTLLRVCVPSAGE
jgi:serine phosphatase RsbU (regulator of sigma subunit)